MYRFAITTFLLGIGAAGATELPLFFEPNQGQAPERVQFISRGNGVASYLCGREARLQVGNSSVGMELRGAADPAGEGVGRLPGLSSYFAGRTARDWHTRIPQYDRVRYRDVYPGIDLVYYGNHGKLEYDFVLRPGADPSRIRVAYSGLKNLRIDKEGNLLLAAESGEIRQRRPAVYQEIDGKRTEVAASYRLAGHGEIGIDVAAYDARRGLTVDPVLEYGTFIGANSGALVTGVKVDSAGNVYLGGSVPATSSNSTSPGAGNAMVVKFSPSQNKVLYWATLAPDGQTSANSLAVDSSGNAIVCGSTASTQFPLVNAFKSSSAGAWKVFVSKFAADGQSLVFSTYFGGSRNDYLNGVAVDASGNAFITGQTLSPDFPVLNALQPKAGFGNTAGLVSNAVLAKFSPAGALLFSTFFGGSQVEAGTSVAVDSGGYPVIVGMAQSPDFPFKNPVQTQIVTEAGFAAKFTPDGQSVVFATALGGTWSSAGSLAFDPQNNIWITGSCSRTGSLPLKNALQTGASGSYISKLSADGSQLLYQSYFGGSVEDGLAGIAVDGSGNLYVGGLTASPDFPLKNSLYPYQNKPSLPVYASTGTWGFVTELSSDGQSLIYSTLLGGTKYQDSVSALTLDSSGALWAAGATASDDFPTKNAYQSTLNGSGAFTAFLVKLTGGGSQSSGPSLTATPGILNFAYVTGGAQPAQQSFGIGTSTGAATPFTVAVSTSSGGNWLSIGTTSGTTPAQLSVTANPAGLAVGAYSGTIHATAANFSAIDIVVSLTVSSPASILQVSAPNLAFAGSGQTQVYVRASDGSSVNVTASASTSSGGSWLSVSPTSFTTAAALTVVANANGLAQGTYNGTVHLAPAGGVGLDINATLIVTQSQQASLTASPASVTFQAAVGGAPPAAQTVNIGSSGGSASYSAAVTSGASWLSVSPQSGTLPAKLSISANTASLASGVYSGIVHVSSATAGSIDVPVTLTVQTAPPAVSPSSLTFGAVAGGAAPQPQTLNATSTGAAVSFTASVSGGTWLSVSPSSGNTPAKLTVSVSAGGLLAGSYLASIAITGGGASVDIPVTLQVAPAPAALISVSPSSVAANAVQPVVTLKGTGFVSGAAVHLGIANVVADQTLSTTFVDANTLQVALPASILTAGNSLSLTVVDPGAAPSNALAVAVTGAAPQISSGAVKNAASQLSGSVAPGELVSIAGTYLGPSEGSAAVADASGTYPTGLAGVQILFDGHPAPILYVSASQVNAIVPFSVAGAQATAVQVAYQGVQSAALSVPVAASAPGLFTADSTGSGQGAILNADMTQNLTTHPAAPNSVVAIYATGAGQMNQTLADGQMVSQLATPLAAVTVTIDGEAAQVLWAGAAPTLVAGMLQVDVVVPATVRTGTAVPVTLHVGNAAAQPGVTLAIQ
jgi:uncharacterized protein (TIGR03437 family)